MVRCRAYGAGESGATNASLGSMMSAPIEGEYYPLNPRTDRAVLGAPEGRYLVPPGIDVLELGLIDRAGQFELLPIDLRDKPLWDEVTQLLVTATEAERQRDIVRRSYHELCAHIAEAEGAPVQRRGVGQSTRRASGVRDHPIRDRRDLEVDAPRDRAAHRERARPAARGGGAQGRGENRRTPPPMTVLRLSGESWIASIGLAVRYERLLESLGQLDECDRLLRGVADERMDPMELATVG